MSLPEETKAPAFEPVVQQELPPYASIEAVRGQKWSPLALGLTSLVCDPLMIPTIMAIVRAQSELREVARREREGHLGAEHARVRTGAIWGMALASGRIVLLLMFCLVSGLAAAISGATDPPGLEDERPATYSTFGGADELSEIRARLWSADGAVRTQAARDLLAHDFVGDEEAEVQELLEHAYGDFPSTPNGGSHVPSAIVRAFAHSDLELPSEHVPRLRSLYPDLDPAGRAAVLQLLADGDEASLQVFYSLVREETTSHPDLRLPLETLSYYDPEEIEPLLALPSTSVFATDVMRVVGARCITDGSEGPPRAVQPVLARARTRWQALRRELASAPPQPGLAGLLSPERRRKAEEAVAALEALACTADYATFREAMESADPRVALAGATQLHELEDDAPIPSAVIQRLAGEPLVLSSLFELFREDPNIRVVWSAEALMRSHLVRHFADEERFAVTEIVPRTPSVYGIRGIRESGEHEAATVIVENGVIEDDASSFYADDIRVEIVWGEYDAARVETLLERLAWHRDESEGAE